MASKISVPITKRFQPRYMENDSNRLSWFTSCFEITDFDWSGGRGFQQWFLTLHDKKGFYFAQLCERQGKIRDPPGEVELGF